MLSQTPQTENTTTSLISPITQNTLVTPVYPLNTPLVSQSLVTVPQIQTGTNYLTVNEVPSYVPQYQIMGLNPVNVDTSTIAQYQTVVPGTAQVGVYALGASQAVQYPTSNVAYLRTAYKPVVKTGYQSVINYKPVLKTGYVPQVQTKYVSIPLDSAVQGTINPTNSIIQQSLPLTETVPLSTSLYDSSISMIPQPLTIYTTPAPIAGNYVINSGNYQSEIVNSLI